MSNFKTLHSIDEIESFIQKNRLAFLYITRPNCSVCHGLRPQIEAILTKYPNIHTATVDANIVTEVAGRFEIFTVPVLLLFYDGKEYIREARIVHTEHFDQKVKRIYSNVFDF